MPRDLDLPPRLSVRLSYLLKRAQAELAEQHDELLAPLGIGVRELTLLMLLDGREPESQQQTAQRAGIDRTTMVALVDGLEAKGHVARRPDPADRRRNVVELTDSGRETLRQAMRASDEAERRVLASLDEAEATQLRSLLSRLGTPS